MDADHFKSINDTLGHDVGDQVIIQLGRLLGKKLDNNELAGRFGGDEFVVFIKDSNDPELARKTVETVLASYGIIPGKDLELEVLKRTKPTGIYEFK